MKYYELKDKNNEQHDEDNYEAGEKRPLIPEGTYKVVCFEIERAVSHPKSLKMFLKFMLIESEYAMTKLFMAMNLIDSKTGKPFKKVPTGSKYYGQWVVANNNTLPTKGANLSPRIFKDGVFEAVVRTVKPTFPDGTLKPECFQYSVVDYLKRRV